MLRPTDIAYLAGLLEGEGYFGFNGTPNIILKMTDLDVIEHAHRLLGAPNPIRVQPHPPHKTGYCIDMGSSLAAGWMMTLYPFMKARRRAKIRGILAHWGRTRLHQRDREKCPRGHFYDTVGTNGERRCRTCENGYDRLGRGRFGRTSDRATGDLFSTGRRA